MPDTETHQVEQNEFSNSVDEQIDKLCHDAMSELLREYGSHHPICESVRDQIKSMHLPHAKRRNEPEIKNRQQ